MKLNRQEKEIVRRKFCAYCIKVLRGEALNYLDELERQRKREVNFSEILQKDLETLYCCDDYDMAENFTVMGRQVPVRDEWICKALKKLPIKIQLTSYHQRHHHRGYAEGCVEGQGHDRKVLAELW